MLFIIFAVYGTTKRLAIVATSRVQIKQMQDKLCDQTGEQWVWVDTLRPGSEGVTFQDTMEYKGFTASGDRYSASITTVIP